MARSWRSPATCAPRACIVQRGDQIVQRHQGSPDFACRKRENPNAYFGMPGARFEISRSATGQIRYGVLEVVHGVARIIVREYIGSHVNHRLDAGDCQFEICVRKTVVRLAAFKLLNLHDGAARARALPGADISETVPADYPRPRCRERAFHRGCDSAAPRSSCCARETR